MENVNEFKKELLEAIETICRDYEQKKLEAKVGEWVIGINECSPKTPARIEGEGNGSNKILSNYDNYNNTQLAINASYCRYATPDEIEAHLKKICDEKGFKEGIEIRGLQEDGLFRKTLYFIRFPCKYDSDEDSYVTASGDRLYCKGKFAEIIPDKKKLPRTKEEFPKFLGDFCNRHCNSVDKFLNQYE